MSRPYGFPVNQRSSSVGDIGQIREGMTRMVISQIQATVVDENKRRDIISYLSKKIKSDIGVEVFETGSMPLKTYLSDGDIDLTTISAHMRVSQVANEIYNLLKKEEQAEEEHDVKVINLIQAKVPLIKLSVNNILVDITFNQFEGLSTLCFMEEVDRILGKNHVFKRSIMLIKAWCFYESHILGGQHRLLTTYALETLILYIFQRFHKSLNDPLSVLHKFLDYFSKFDWENNCVNIYAPVSVSTSSSAQNDDGELLLSREYLKNRLERLSIPSLHKTHSEPFRPRFMNIVDPLKENNNLGGNITQGNYYRIVCAFEYGARDLHRILQLPTEKIANELKNFFEHTLKESTRLKQGSFRYCEALLDLTGDYDHNILCVDFARNYILASEPSLQPIDQPSSSKSASEIEWEILVKYQQAIHTRMSLCSVPTIPSPYHHVNHFPSTPPRAIPIAYRVQVGNVSGRIGTSSFNVQQGSTSFRPLPTLFIQHPSSSNRNYMPNQHSARMNRGWQGRKAPNETRSATPAMRKEDNPKRTNSEEKESVRESTPLG